MGALSRLGCGAASTSQAKWCEVVIPSQNITSQRSPWTVLTWSSLTVSDPAYFIKSPAVANGLRILVKGYYRIELTIREIYNNALGQQNNAKPRQVYPLYSQGLGYIGRFWDGDPGTAGLPEYAADNSFEGQPIAAGFDPFNDPFLLAEWAARYTATFRIDGALIFPPLDVQIIYRQLSGATQTLSALSRAAVTYFPSDIDNNPSGYGTVYNYP